MRELLRTGFSRDSPFQQKVPVISTSFPLLADTDWPGQLSFRAFPHLLPLWLLRCAVLFWKIEIIMLKNGSNSIWLLHFCFFLSLVLCWSICWFGWRPLLRSIKAGFDSGTNPNRLLFDAHLRYHYLERYRLVFIRRERHQNWDILVKRPTAT